MRKSSVIPKSVTEYDLRLLRVFKGVVESGGISAAEPVLGVTRSTISNHLSSLETRMQLTLCTRGRSGFSLTEDGQAIYHATLTLFKSLEDFSAQVANLGKELSGDLVILCADQLNGEPQRQFAHIIATIHQHAPNLHLALEIDSVGNIETQLLKDKAHIGLLPAYRSIDGLQYQAAIAEPIYLCCSKQHPLFNIPDEDISDADISAMPAIHPGIDVDNQGREKLTQLNLRARAYQFNTRKSLILSGAYIGYMPQSHIQAELEQGELRLLNPKDYQYVFSLSVVTKQAPRENKKVQFVKDCFAGAFSAID